MRKFAYALIVAAGLASGSTARAQDASTIAFESALDASGYTQITGNGLTGIGDDVTLEPGTGRLLQQVIINAQTLSDPGTAEYTPAFVTLTLYNNDGAGGLPGTVIGSSTIEGPTFPAGGNSSAGGLDLEFPFADLLVPDTFSYVFVNQNANMEPDGANPDGNQFGPFVDFGQPSIGDSPETILARDADGFFRDTFGLARLDITSQFITAVPEPSGLAFGAISVALLARRRRRQ